MTPSTNCPRGHDWPGHPDDCPSCAGAGDSHDHRGGSTIGDELPPAPSASRPAAKPIPQKQEPALGTDASPVIPGYVILGELGRGGMGTVYRARHLALNRLVALKVNLLAATTESHAFERFRFEAESVAHLQHPNIVQVFEIGSFSGRPYFALELVTGGTLARKLAGQPMAATPAANLLETLARAVQFAHEHYLVHRDLKPANILLCAPEGADPHTALVPKIADFGLAKRIGIDSTQTTTGVAVGTPSYMAPEQAAGLSQFVGPACDIYALGAVLYELLTGRPPFHAASAVETLQQVIEHEPVPPGRLQPGVPRDLETICLKCLQKEMRKRYATAGELADDLRRFLEGRPIVARRTGLLERAVKWAYRRPAAAGLIAVSLLAASALLALTAQHMLTLNRHNDELRESAINLQRERDEARRQTVRAEINLESANEAISQMLRRVGIDRLRAQPFMERTRVELLEDAVRFYDKLLAEQAGDPRLQFQRAHTLEQSASVLFSLGRYKEARARYDSALVALDEIQAAPDVALAWLRARMLNGRSLVLAQLSEMAKGRSDQEAAMAIREQLLAADPANTIYQYDLAASYLNLAVIASVDRKLPEIALYLGRAQPLAEALTRAHGENPNHWHLLGLVLNDLGVYCLDTGDSSRALECFERAVEVDRNLIAFAESNVDFRSELARALTNTSTALRKQGYLRRAIAPLEEAIEIRQRLAAEHPHTWPLVLDLAWSQVQRGELHRAQGKNDPAFEQYSSAIDRLEKDGQRTRQDARARAYLCDAYIGRANACDGLGKPLDMAAALKNAAELAESDRQADLKMMRAVALAHGGKLAEAVALAESVLREDKLAAEVFFNGARIFARALGSEKAPGQKDDLAKRSIRLLERAEQAGYFRPDSRRGALDHTNDLKALQGHKDFAALRMKIAGR